MTDEVALSLLDALLKDVAARERKRRYDRERMRGLGLEARQAYRRSYFCRNSDYERGRLRLLRQYRRGGITREEYLAQKRDLHARTHQGYADEIIRRLSFGARARECAAHG